MQQNYAQNLSTSTFQMLNANWSKYRDLFSSKYGNYIPTETKGELIEENRQLTRPDEEMR